MILQFKKDKYGWGDTFYVYNDQNEKAYFVKSSIMLFSKKFVICDLDKNVLVTIKNEPKSLLKKKYYINTVGRDTVTVTKEISLVPKYIIEGCDWQLNGVMLHNYSMLSGGSEVLHIDEQSTPWGYRPVLTIADGVDPLAALGMVLTISYVMNAQEGGTPTNHR